MGMTSVDKITVIKILTQNVVMMIELYNRTQSCTVLAMILNSKYKKTGIKE